MDRNTQCFNPAAQLALLQIHAVCQTHDETLAEALQDLDLRALTLDDWEQSARQILRGEGGDGYVGLSNAKLLAQHSQVHVIDIVPAKVYTRNLIGQD